MKIYTSEEILADIDGCVQSDEIYYQLTPGELQWLNFINGRYAIADYFFKVLDENNVVRIDSMEMSEAIYADNGNWPKATMLSDDTALQKIIFYNYIDFDVPYQD